MKYILNIQLFGGRGAKGEDLANAQQRLKEAEDDKKRLLAMKK